MTECSVVAVHLGAGPPLSTGRQIVFEKLCKSACRYAMRILRVGGSALDAVCEAVRILEDSAYTNAGVGSNLTICGKVECDASVMDGKTLNFGAVGCLSDIKNPILVAKTLLQEQDKGLLPLGRIPPCLMVSEGAKCWALEHGFTEVDNNVMVTRRALQIHQKNKLNLDNYTSIKKPKLEEQILESEIIGEPCHNTSLDTIGAVCIDSSGNVASACSSGGIVLKHSGRVGQAAVYAAGCWAENGEMRNLEKSDSTERSCSVASVTTGVGENLIKTMFSRECAQCVKSTDDPHKSLKDLFDAGFLKSRMLKEKEERLAGALIMRCDGEVIDVLVGHTTASMCFAYAEQTSSRVNLVFSQLPLGAVPGACVQIQGVMIKR